MTDLSLLSTKVLVDELTNRCSSMFLVATTPDSQKNADHQNGVCSSLFVCRTPNEDELFQCLNSIGIALQSVAETRHPGDPDFLQFLLDIVAHGTLEADHDSFEPSDGY